MPTPTNRLRVICVCTVDDECVVLSDSSSDACRSLCHSGITEEKRHPSLDYFMSKFSVKNFGVFTQWPAVHYEDNSNESEGLILRKTPHQRLDRPTESQLNKVFTSMKDIKTVQQNMLSPISFTNEHSKITINHFILIFAHFLR